MSTNFEQKLSQWLDIVNNNQSNLIEKCFKLASIIEYPDLNIEKYTQKIKEIGISLRENTEDKKNPTYLISMLNEHLFDKYGFVGDEDDYYDPKNNFLNDVLDKKSGLPITIAVIYVEVAKYIGLELEVVGFPSHILVKYKDEIIIDPFYGGRVVGVEDMQQILDVNFGGQLEFTPEFLASVTSQQILVRMTRNLKNSYLQSYAFEKALLCIDMVMSLEKNVPEDIRDKGIIEEKLSNFETALKYLNEYLEMNPNAGDVDLILNLIQSIRKKISQ